MNSPVQQIKERLSIEEVVSSYVKLEKAGANLKAKCPFHSEKTPSFFISPDRGSYYCFGCGAKGDIFTFIEEFEGLDFKGALKLLAERAGVPLSAYTYDKEVESEKEKLYRVMEEATKYFSQNLERNHTALSYLASRGLEKKTIKDFRVGYALGEWRELYNYFKQKGFTDGQIEQAGLAKKSEKGFYDRFRSRIMFPISDSSGRVIAFSGRIFPESAETEGAKYLNSPETPIFSKFSVLYGLDRAKDSIRKNNFSILVEGQMDLVLSHQAGFRNTVATSGTALSESTVGKENAVSNLGLVRRLSTNIVLAFDADKAGLNATLRAGKIALSLGMDVKVAKMSKGVDPADLISQSGSDAWREAIKNSRHLIEFLLDKILEDSGGDARKAGREIKEHVLPYVSALESSMEQMHFLKKISDLSGISETAIKDDLKKVEQEAKYDNVVIGGPRVAEPTKFRRDYIERRLLGIALWKEDKELEKLLGGILEKYNGSEDDLIFEAEVFYEGNIDLEKETKELLANLEKERINEELLRKMQELHTIKDKDSEIKLLQEIQELNKQKNEEKK